MVGIAVDTIVPSTALKKVAMNKANVTIPLFVFSFSKTTTPISYKFREQSIIAHARQ